MYQLIMKGDFKMEETMKIPNDLTSRQWSLYNYLKEHETRTFSTKEIYLLFIDEYPKWDITTDWNTSTTRRTIAYDLEAIGKSKRVHHVLSRGSNKIGVLDKEETLKYLTKKTIALKKQWKELYDEWRKAELDQQMRLVFGKEKDVIEAFAYVDAKEEQDG